MVPTVLDSAGLSRETRGWWPVQALLAVMATVASAAFAGSVLRQWWRRRRPYQLAWGVSLAMFALGSAALAAGVGFGWSRPTFEAYYLFGALLTVPVLALGTLELLAGRTVARTYLVALLAFAAASIVLLAAAPIDPADLAGELPEGSQVLPVGVRVLAGVGNGVGTLIVVGGALVTVIGAARADRSTWYRQPRVQGTGLIAAGVLVAAAGGSVAAIGRSASLALALAAGAAVMYAGFRRASAPRRAPERTPP
jgi:hypothetical protein